MLVLQKYRSHRKHLLAREAEAVSWSETRHAFAPVMAGAVLGKRERGSPWLVPSIGFPPMTPPPQHIHGDGHNNRPLHVWSHPSVDQSSLRPVWPKPLPHSPSSQQPHPIWPSPAHSRDSSPYWHNKRTVSQSVCKTFQKINLQAFYLKLESSIISHTYLICLCFAYRYEMDCAKVHLASLHPLEQR